MSYMLLCSDFSVYDSILFQVIAASLLADKEREYILAPNNTSETAIKSEALNESQKVLF